MFSEMSMSRIVFFDAVPGALNSRNGDNGGFIYSSATQENSGEEFEIRAGESVMIVPRQPDNCGPWKMFSFKYVDNRFWRQSKARKYMSFIVTNHWHAKSIKVYPHTRLQLLFSLPGIQTASGDCLISQFKHYLSTLTETHPSQLVTTEHTRHSPTESTSESTDSSDTEMNGSPPKRFCPDPDNTSTSNDDIHSNDDNQSKCSSCRVLRAKPRHYR